MHLLHGQKPRIDSWIVLVIWKIIFRHNICVYRAFDKWYLVSKQILTRERETQKVFVRKVIEKRIRKVMKYYPNYHIWFNFWPFDTPYYYRHLCYPHKVQTGNYFRFKIQPCLVLNPIQVGLWILVGWSGVGAQSSSHFSAKNRAFQGTEWGKKIFSMKPLSMMVF